MDPVAREVLQRRAPRTRTSVITTSTATPRRAAPPSADSIVAESISSFSPNNVWRADSISPTSVDVEPGLHTNPGALDVTYERAKSAPKVPMMARTSLARVTSTQQSRVEE